MVERSRLLPAIYVLLALPMALMFAMLTPPFQVPDEVEHYLYARMLTEGQILPTQLPGSGAGGAGRSGDLELIGAFSNLPFRPDEKASAQAFETAGRIDEGDSIQNNFWGAAIYPPTAYVAPALGLAAADAMGASRLAAFYIGRAANALMFVAAAMIALWIVPAGKGAFALVLLLPMTLSQAGSFSADAHVFGMTALICALLAREALRPPRPGVLVITAVLMVLVALTKAPLIALVIPLTALAWRHSKALAAALAVVALTAFVTWTSLFVLTEAQAARAAGLSNVSAARQVEFLFTSPSSIVAVAWNTLTTMSPFYFKSMIGVFGWLDTPLGVWFYWLASLALGALVVATAIERHVSTLRWSFALAATIAAALTFGALYVSWTPVGADIVQGVQGRYFIPILFPTALAMAGVFPRGISSTATAVPAVLLWAATIVHVPWVLMVRFYLH